jgi:hypothetical protein
VQRLKEFLFDVSRLRQVLYDTVSLRRLTVLRNHYRDFGRLTSEEQVKHREEMEYLRQVTLVVILVFLCVVLEVVQQQRYRSLSGVLI